MEGNYKPGSFPDADEANVFGRLYLAFVSARESNRDATPAYQGAVEWAYSQTKEDPEFRKFYSRHVLDVAGDLRQLSPTDMARVLGECKAVLARNGLWRYRGPLLDTTEWEKPTP